MRKLTFYLLVLAATTSSNSRAQNIVPNPSFETFTACPASTINFATTPPSIAYNFPNLNGWQVPTLHNGNPDALNVCETAGLWGVPGNVSGNQLPNTGNGYVGLSLFNGNFPGFREYIEVQLTCPMIAGDTYNVSMFVSLADIDLFGTDNGLGVHFSNAALVGPGSANQIAITPSWTNTTLITDKTNWVQLTFTYVATGGEVWMTIGNFNDDVTTNTVAQATGAQNSSYIYLDDVSVVPANGITGCVLPIELIGFDAEVSNNEVVTQWSTQSELNNDYFIVERSADSEHFEFVGRMDGAGTSNQVLNYQFTDADPLAGTSYYRLKQVDFDGTTSYSDPKAVALNDLISAEIYPNPSQEGYLNVVISMTQAKQVDLEILDINGKSMLVQSFKSSAGSETKKLDISHLTAGLYFVRLSSKEQGILTKKLVVK